MSTPHYPMCGFCLREGAALDAVGTYSVLAEVEIDGRTETLQEACGDCYEAVMGHPLIPPPDAAGIVGP